MSDDLTVSEVARELGREIGTEVSPRHISDLFYQRILPEDFAPIVGGRRLIARKHLPLIREALQRRGKLGAPPAGGHK